MSRPIKTVVVTNVPSPYRVPVFQRVADMPDIELFVIYCAPPHIDPTLVASAHSFPVHFLQGRYWAMQKRFMHMDRQVWALLDRLKPDVVITTGFIPTFLYAIAWAFSKRIPHIVMTDGTLQSEMSLSFVHRWIRREVFKRSAAFVGACDGSLDMFRSYGVVEDRLHKSMLCVDNDRFDLPQVDDPADFIFCGRFVAHKRPLFALDVARRTSELLGRKTRIEFVGTGELASEMQAHADSIGDLVEVRFHGYVSQAELPARYAAARLFLFPSEWDPWGLVANEASAAGLPVIVSPHAGVAGELVQDGKNGFVIPLDVEAWANAACLLLRDAASYQRFSLQAKACVKAYSFDHSARGLAAAVRQAVPALDADWIPTDERFGQQPSRAPTDALDDTVIRRSEGKVCIVQAVAKQYRKPFFDRLYVRLRAEGIVLQVLYSDPNPHEALRRDAIDLPEAYGVKLPALWIKGRKTLYQPALKYTRDADLVIVEQASKHVLNYLLQALHATGQIKLAYWGHGRNWQRDADTFSEKLKRVLLTGVDWWFAYTRRVGEYVVAQGFPASRVTIVQNSIDLAALQTDLAGWTHAQRSDLCEQSGIAPGEPVALFCGSLHGDKRLAFLLEAADLVRARLPTFHLIVVGAGPEQSRVDAAASTRNWVHAVGRQLGVEKAGYFAIADVFLCPGLVGLAILDAFTAGLPLFTTDIPIHSPEVDYLEHDVNGVMTPHDPQQYADAIIACLGDPVALLRLRDNARAASARYGLDAMVENFAGGVLSCLKRS